MSAPEAGPQDASTQDASTGPTGEQVWRALERASFAVVSHLTPSGAPRSSGVVYATVGRRIYAVVAADGWKARHIAADGRVSVTVPVRRGGLLSLVFPIPPAAISFSGSASVLEARSPEGARVLKDLGRLLPVDRQDPSLLDDVRIVEIRPEGHFVTYGIGVTLMQMRDPERARGRVAVG